MARTLLLLTLGACSGPGAGSDADADTNDTSDGAKGDFPPFPAGTAVTLRVGGVDTTFDCGGSTAFRLDDTTEGFDDPHRLMLGCSSADSDGAAGTMKGFGLSALGTFATGTSSTLDIDPERPGQNDTLDVAFVENHEGWSITLNGNGGTFFVGTLTLEALGASGERAAGTLQASWDLVLMDPDGDGSAELVEQPTTMSCAFDLVRM